ncbi:MAG: hypothetical protein CSB24_02705 [Deltaproteobacteria bacterium]|nr:MAG: hypothetical protein CSB24_02705 [Deltaproteobacteria bacterium]
MKGRTVRMTTIEFTSASLADLRGKQSVRTTFRLSVEAITALSVMAGQMGIKQKTLFDHLMDGRILKIIAQEYDRSTNRPPGQPKTYVISRRTLDLLDIISKKYEVPRDALVEAAISRIMPMIEEEKKKHRQRMALHKKMTEIFDEGRRLLIEMDENFAEGDPVFTKYLHTLKIFENNCSDVEDYLQKGRQLENF